MKKKIFLFVSVILVCCFFSGCGDSDKKSISSEKNNSLEKETSAELWEEKTVISADNVSVTKDDYKEMKRLKAFLRNALIDNPDADKIENLKRKTRELLGDDWLADKGWKYYLSCVPIISWSYENNQIYDIETGLYMFDKKKKNGYLMQLAEDDLDFDGFVMMNLEWMGDNPKEKYIWTKADFIKSCFIDKDNIAYESIGAVYSDNLLEVTGDYYGRFHVEQIGVSLDELTNLSDCIAWDLSTVN